MSIKTEVAELKALLKTHGDRFAVFMKEKDAQMNKVMDLLCSPHVFKYVGQVYIKDGADRGDWGDGFECSRCGRQVVLAIKELTDELVKLIVEQDPEYYANLIQQRYDRIRSARKEFVDPPKNL